MFRSKFLGSTVFIEILTLLIISCTIFIYMTWGKYQPLYPKFLPTQNGEHMPPYCVFLTGLLREVTQGNIIIEFDKRVDTKCTLVELVNIF